MNEDFKESFFLGMMSGVWTDEEIQGIGREVYYPIHFLSLDVYVKVGGQKYDI